jgi:hypothetical protein
MNQKKHGGFAHFENGRKDKNPFQKCHYERKKYICFQCYLSAEMSKQNN